MTYTVTTLITKAFYLSGIVSRNLETVSGDQLSDGLELLNALLSFKTADGLLVPYWKLTPETLISGQETYFYPNLVAVESVTFNIGPIRYAMLEYSRKNYFASSRIDNISSLPYAYRCERALDGANISFYFLPESDFPIHIMGKYALLNVTFNEDLETFYDDFYIEYLRYELALMICNEYQIEMLPQQMAILQSYRHRLRNVGAADLTMMKQSTLIVEPGINYADVNLGKGWRP